MKPKRQTQLIDVIIPAYNEEGAIGNVIEAIPKQLVREIIVCNNRSTDNTRTVAEAAGATVLDEDRPGYGWACLKGMAHCSNQDVLPDIVVFLDGDFSDYPEQMPLLVDPIISNAVDMVIGSRASGDKEKGSMTPQQIFGNWLATKMIKVLYGVTFTDLGPFRAISWEALTAIDMQDKTYGWTVEMQVKAAKLGLKTIEVPVKYKKRIGVSKVSGTVKGTLLAGYKIITTILKYSLTKTKR